jgi:hypothetical protein
MSASSSASGARRPPGFSVRVESGKRQSIARVGACLVEQQKRDGWRCECGKAKKPQYVTCYTCKTEVKQ